MGLRETLSGPDVGALAQLASVQPSVSVWHQF